MTAKKEVAKKENTAIALDERPDWMTKTSTRGSEEVTSNDVTLPRLQIIQDLSKQHKKNKEEYIEGAEVGDFFNTASQQLYKESALIVPVYFKVEYIIWKDQDAGGGFFGAFPTEVEAQRKLPEAIQQGGGTEDQYEIVQTNVHFVMIVSEDNEIEQAVISMSKSQNKVSRNWNTMIKMAGGDRFARVYRLSTVTDTNKANQEYMNWKVKPVGWVNQDVYKVAEEMYEAVKAGERGVDYGESETKQSEPKKAEADGDFDDEFKV